jgi:hypothetical protein
MYEKCRENGFYGVKKRVNALFTPKYTIIRSYSVFNAEYGVTWFFVKAS